MSRSRLSMIIWFIFITYVIIVASWWIGQQALRYPILAVEINDDIEHITQQEIKGVVLDFIKPGFFALNKDALKARLSNLPWVEIAEVKKVWPGRLVIKLTEKRALARWGDDGFITASGEIFYPLDPGYSLLEGSSTGTTMDRKTSTDRELPIFRGNKSDAASMLENYLFLNERMQTIGLRIKELKIMPDYGWRAMLDNEVILFLGKGAVPERTKRFLLAYKGLLQAKIDKVAYIDTRYTNGISVGWKN